MSDLIVIDGVPPWDGSYDLDIEAQPLTTVEWGWIKRRAGYLPLTLTGDAFADPELIAVLAAIAVRRAGTLEDREMPGLLDRLFDAPFGQTITMTAGATEGDADPPPPSSDVKLNSNGDSSTTASDPSETIPPATGPRASDISASGLSMSVS